MDRIKQYQKITNIKPQYKKLVHPFHKTSMIKIKFLTKEYELQYNDIGVWKDADNKKTKTKGGFQYDPLESVVVSDICFN